MTETTLKALQVATLRAAAMRLADDMICAAIAGEGEGVQAGLAQASRLLYDMIDEIEATN